MARVSNHIHVKQWDVVTHLCHNFNDVELRALMGDYIPWKVRLRIHVLISVKPSKQTGPRAIATWGPFTNMD